MIQTANPAGELLEFALLGKTQGWPQAAAGGRFCFKMELFLRFWPP